MIYDLEKNMKRTSETMKTKPGKVNTMHLYCTMSWQHEHLLSPVNTKRCSC